MGLLAVWTWNFDGIETLHGLFYFHFVMIPMQTIVTGGFMNFLVTKEAKALGIHSSRKSTSNTPPTSGLGAVNISELNNTV
jgi:hypothetical protein